MSSSGSKIRKRNPNGSSRRDVARRRLCPHCNTYLVIRTWKAHRRMYYDKIKDTWIMKSTTTVNVSSIPDSDDACNSDGPTIPGFDIAPNRLLNTPTLHFSESDSEPNSSVRLKDATPRRGDDYMDEEWIDDEMVANGYASDLLENTDSSTMVPDSVDSSMLSSRSSKQGLLLAKWLSLFLLKLQAVYQITNGAINALFSFLHAFLKCLSAIHEDLKGLAEAFPKSSYMAHKLFHRCVTFTKYVVCPKCWTLYNMNDCIKGARKTCLFQRFPHHKQSRMRVVCGATLLKSVHMAGGKQIHYPYLIYCYLGLDVMLQHFLSKPGFADVCDIWRNRSSNSQVYKDVYDGKIWKDFQIVDGAPFLNQSNNFSIILNMDFFQPYKHLKGYSVGAIYAVIMNLPRDIRYKRENVILIGLIPGPKEPEHDINSFLNPLVDELLILWTGKSMVIDNCTKLVRCALLCVACDIPGGRKTCGFLGHCAHLGCSKCLKKFPGSAGKMDYAGFNRQDWILRNGVEHRRIGMGMRQFSSLAEQESMESSEGLRYSALLKLPYFDAPRMLIIDPMHNLFLGTAKYYLHRILIDRCIIDDRMWELIQNRMDSIVVPPGIGRIPYKIRSGFSSFTADQWKNWTIYYSLIVLHDLLDKAHLECWRHFVLACRYLCHKTLSKDDLKLGDILLMQFCKRTEQLCGRDVITPNMHMHAHLKVCVEDYGPLHGFWLYAFERYNGILEDIPHNNRSIECQLMSRFVDDNLSIGNEVPSDDLPEALKLQFLSMSVSRSGKQTGSLGDTCSSSESNDEPRNWEYDELKIHLPTSRSHYVFTELEKRHLQELLMKLNDTTEDMIEVPSVCWKYSSIQMADTSTTIGTHCTRSHTSSTVAGTWEFNIFGSPLSSVVDNFIVTGHSMIRPMRISSFLLVQAQISSVTRPFLLASVLWNKFHPKMYHFGKPLSIWCSNVFECEGIYSVIPVQLIFSRIIHCTMPVDEETVFVMCPCIDF